MIFPYYTTTDPISGELIHTLAPAHFSVNGIEYTVPAFFVSDGMSVPRWLWGILAPPDDEVTLVPSIIHDWLYTTHICTRLEADIWYYHALLANGYPEWKCVLTFVGVRLFGGPHWRNK